MPFSRCAYTLLVVSILLALWGVVADIRNIHAGGSIDLRNRVTGARLAADGREPYFFKWTVKEKDEYCDPCNAIGQPISKTTVSPALLALHVPLNDLNYRTIQWVWLLLQYTCLGLGFWAWAAKRPHGDVVWAAVLTLLFCASASWRLHSDRGQTYVIYAAALLGVARLGEMRGKPWQFLEGMTGALLVGLRPIYLGAPGVPLLRRRWMALAGVAAAGALTAAVTAWLFDFKIWKTYQEGMAVHSRLYLSQEKLPNAFMTLDRVEGISIDKLYGYARIPFADTSVYKLVSFALPPGVLFGVWAAAVALSGLWMARRGVASRPVIWWTVAAWALIGDFLLPAFRNTYNDILVWPMLLLGLGALRGRAKGVWIALSLALVLLHCAVWLTIVPAHAATKFLPKEFIPVPTVAGLALAAGVVLWTVFGPVREVQETGPA